MKEIRVISNTEYKKSLKGEIVAAVISLGFLVYLYVKFASLFN